MIIKTVLAQNGNELQFAKYAHITRPHIVVHDLDCQMERVYFIGEIKELDGFEDVAIKSKAQVMRAWTEGKVHF
tara:strand:+ start:48 stop:269 length:222 start_codon:yes stop_codon:yes gene_type:complete